MRCRSACCVGASGGLAAAGQSYRLKAAAAGRGGAHGHVRARRAPRRAPGRDRLGARLRAGEQRVAHHPQAGGGQARAVTMPTVLERLEHPIVQAPLRRRAGDAGAGRGGLRGGRDRLPGRRLQDAGGACAQTLAELRALTERPFGLNVFAPPGRPPSRARSSAYARALGGEAERPASSSGSRGTTTTAGRRSSRWRPPSAVPVVSFTFGCPPRERIGALHAAGVEVWVTVTTPAEARRGGAGGRRRARGPGRRGGRAPRRPSTTTRRATSACSRCCSWSARRSTCRWSPPAGSRPGRGVAAVLAAGAAAAQLGTAFMLTPEAGTSRGAPRGARAATGRPRSRARSAGAPRAGSSTASCASTTADAPSAYPEVHHLTAPLRAAAREAGDPDGFHLWAGQAHALARELPAGELVRRLAAEAAGR